MRLVKKIHQFYFFPVYGAATFLAFLRLWGLVVGDIVFFGTNNQRDQRLSKINRPDGSGQIEDGCAWKKKRQGQAHRANCVELQT